MSRVITYARHYMTGHPRAGEETYFVEKVTKGFYLLGYPIEDFDGLDYFDDGMYHMADPKYHTVRAGHRWKVGDKFNARVWSGRPYHSIQIALANDVPVKKIWDFKTTKSGHYLLNDRPLKYHELEEVAKNDGLSMDSFECWFPKVFDGQIICWNDKINY